MTTASDRDLLDAFLLRIEQYDQLSGSERTALREAVGPVEGVAAHVDLIREGDRPSVSTIMLQGISCRYKMLDNGDRQIVALHVPGDFVDLHSFPLKVMDHSVATLAPSRVARVPHERLRRLTEDHPHLARLLWLQTLVDGAIMREWLVGVGRRSATERMAHLLCEIQFRLEAVGLDGNDTFELPITQLELGDMLGLSAVHTNRVLQDFRARALLRWEGATVQLLDKAELMRLSGFDPDYLHLRKEAR